MVESGCKLLMKRRIRLLGAGGIAMFSMLLASCSLFTDTSCVGNTDYAHAQAFPKMKSPLGLQVPKPDQDMQIPQVRSGPVTTYDAVPTGIDPDSPPAKCLTTPPPLGHSS
jgi:uncharacterized lipoprotein